MEITIKLKVKGVEIKLTRQEAKELADALDGLTGTERWHVIPYYPGTIPVPWYPTYPTYPWPYTPFVWTNTGGTMALSNDDI